MKISREYHLRSGIIETLWKINNSDQTGLKTNGIEAESLE